MRRFWSALWSNPVAAVGGSLMVGCGVAFSGTSGWERIAGNVLAAFGGVLLSAEVAKAYASNRLNSDLQIRLATVGTHLGTVSGQINQAVMARERGDSEEGTLLALIAYSARELYTLVDDIQRIAGSRFESSDLLSTVETLQDLATRFEVLTSSQGTPLPGELDDLRADLDAIQASLSQKESIKTTEIVACPECSNRVTLEIGALPGASALPTCPRCGKRFHAHRGGAGELFTKAMGGQSSKMRELGVICPTCQKQIQVRLPEGDSEPKTRWCLDCYSRLLIAASDGHVEEVFPEEPLKGRIVHVEDSDGHSRIECPSCGKTAVAFFKRDQRVFAVCYSDNRLLVADAPDPTPSPNPVMTP